MRFKAEHLPQDILTLFVDNLASQYKECKDGKSLEALTSCRQAGSHFYDRTTFHLFNLISFTPRVIDACYCDLNPCACEELYGREELLETKKILSRFKLLRDILQHNPNLGLKVRSLRIYMEFFDEDEEFWMDLSRILPDIFSKLRNIAEFRLRSGMEWSFIPSRLKHSLLQLLATPSLHSIRLLGLRNVPAVVLRSSPGLKHLSLHAMQFPFERSWYPTPPDTPHQRLISFATYDTSPPVVQWLVSHPYMFSNLTRLCIGIDTGFMPIALDILKLAAGTLEWLDITDIELELGEPRTLEVDLDLGLLKSLKYLAIRTATDIKMVTAPYLARKILDCKTSHRTLEKLELAFGWIDQRSCTRTEEVFKDREWSRLDAILSSENYHTVKAVNASLQFCNPNLLDSTVWSARSLRDMEEDSDDEDEGENWSVGLSEESLAGWRRLRRKFDSIENQLLRETRKKCDVCIGIQPFRGFFEHQR